MRWFKHMTLTRSDEKIARVFDELGVEGYGVFWCVLEEIARTVDQNCSENSSEILQLSSKNWGKICGFSSKKFEKFAEIFKKIGIFSVNFIENEIAIGAPNLLKYRDEWTQRKRKTRDKLPSDSRVTPEQETDTDTDTDVDVDVDKRTKACEKAASNNNNNNDDAPEKPPLPITASTSISPIIAADRNRLASALGKTQVSDAELLQWQALKAIGVKLSDVECARKRKAQNRLTSFLGEIACEERDRRLADADDGYEQPHYFQTGGVQ